MKAIDEQVAGSLLRSARLRLGLSQTRFADVLGIAQPTLSAYESGRRQPTLPTLLRMLNRAGLDLRLELVERDDHDDVLAEWETTLDDATRRKLRSQGYRLVSTESAGDEKRLEVACPTSTRGESSMVAAAVTNLDL